MKNKSTISHSSWWIIGILGAIIGLATSDGKNTGLMLFVGISNGLFWGWILGLILDSILNSKTLNNIENKITEIKENKEIVKDTNRSLSEYQDAKNRFQYLSTETLIEKHKTYTENMKSDMICLALEEEMVERGILEYSPMHEKLEKLNNHFLK